MKKKEIKPISFKKENPQEGVQLQGNSIQQASMRGSGSGESKEEGNFGGGRGVISSVNGGTWMLTVPSIGLLNTSMKKL